MKKLILLLSLCLSASCQNDTLVTGFVYTTKDAPIEGVKVQVNSSDIYTVTDKDGYFEIDTNNISDELLFNKKGFQLKFLSLYALKTDGKVILIEAPVVGNTSE